MHALAGNEDTRRGVVIRMQLFGCVRSVVARVYPLLVSRTAWLGVMSVVKPLVVFVLGGPGAGKGTQCANIVRVSLDGVPDLIMHNDEHAHTSYRSLVLFISLLGTCYDKNEIVDQRMAT